MKHKVSVAKNIVLSRILKRPFKVNFIVTRRCNSRCITCLTWQKSVKDKNLRDSELGLGQFRRIFKKMPSTVSWISFSGGEPFMKGDFTEIILSAAELIPSLKLISVPTNGLEHDKIQKTVLELREASEKIKRFPHIFFTFSLDGPRDVHDRIRGIKGAFDRTYRSFREIKKMVRNSSRFEVGIETTVSKFNEGRLGEFIKGRIDNKEKLIMTVAHNAFLYNNQSSGSMIPRDIREFEKIVNMLKRHQRWHRIDELVERMYLSRIVDFVRNPKKKVMSCVALQNSVSVDAEGNVIPCFMWGYRLGNIKQHDYDLMKVWNSDRAEQAKKLIKQDKCPNCWTPCQAYLSLFWRFAP